MLAIVISTEVIVAAHVVDVTVALHIPKRGKNEKKITKQKPDFQHQLSWMLKNISGTTKIFFLKFTSESFILVHCSKNNEEY